MPLARVEAFPWPTVAGLLDENVSYTEIFRVILGHMKQIPDIAEVDIIAPACTHYQSRLVRGIIRKSCERFGANPIILDHPKLTLQYVLEHMNLTEIRKPYECIFATTGDPDMAYELSLNYIGPGEFEQFLGPDGMRFIHIPEDISPHGVSLQAEVKKYSGEGYRRPKARIYDYP